MLASVEVPAGSYTVAAKSHLYNTTEDSFAVCELRAGAAVIDESINRLISPANDQVVPFLGVVTLTGRRPSHSSATAMAWSPSRARRRLW